MKQIITQEIPQQLLQQAERELMVGEHILWAGKPRPLLFTPVDILAPFAVCCLLLGCTINMATEAPLWLCWFGRGLLFCIGISGVLAPAALRVARGYMLCAVTTHRALKIYPRFFTFWKTESYGAARLRHMRVKSGGDGYGDIIFGYYQLTAFTPIEWGFKDIPHVRQAAKLLQQLCDNAAHAHPCRLDTGTPPDIDPRLSAEQRKIMTAAMQSGESPCYAEPACRHCDFFRLFETAMRVAACVFITGVIISMYIDSGFSVRFTVTAVFYMCLLYIFAKDTAVFLRERRRLHRRFYVLTTQRALVLHPDIGIEQAFTLTRFIMQEHHIRPDGSGSLVLGYANPDTADVQNADPLGFLQLSSVRKVEKILQSLR